MAWFSGALCLVVSLFMSTSSAVENVPRGCNQALAFGESLKPQEHTFFLVRDLLAFLAEEPGQVTRDSLEYTIVGPESQFKITLDHSLDLAVSIGDGNPIKIYLKSLLFESPIPWIRSRQATSESENVKILGEWVKQLRQGKIVETVGVPLTHEEIILIAEVHRVRALAETVPPQRHIERDKFVQAVWDMLRIRYPEHEQELASHNTAPSNIGSSKLFDGSNFFRFYRLHSSDSLNLSDIFDSKPFDHDSDPIRNGIALQIQKANDGFRFTLQPTTDDATFFKSHPMVYLKIAESLLKRGLPVDLIWKDLIPRQSRSLRPREFIEEIGPQEDYDVLFSNEI